MNIDTRYEIVKVWANFDLEREENTRTFYSSYEHAQMACGEKNAKRTGIYFHSFVVKDRCY